MSILGKGKDEKKNTQTIVTVNHMLLILPDPESQITDEITDEKQNTAGIVTGIHDRNRDRGTQNLDRPRDRPARMNDYQSERFSNGPRRQLDSDANYRHEDSRSRYHERPQRRDHERRGRDNYNRRDRRRDYEERPRRGNYESPGRRSDDRRRNRNDENDGYLTARDVPNRGVYNEGYTHGRDMPPPEEEEEGHYERLSIAADPVPPDLIMDSQSAESRSNRNASNEASVSMRDLRGYSNSRQRMTPDQSKPQYNRNNYPKPAPRKIRPRGEGVPNRLSSKRRRAERTNPDGSVRRRPRSAASSMYSYDDEGDDWGDDWDDDNDNVDSEDGYDTLQDYFDEQEEETVDEPDYVNTEPDYVNSQPQSVNNDPDYENQNDLPEVHSTQSNPNTYSSLAHTNDENNLEEKLSKQLNEFKGSRNRPKSDSVLNFSA